MSTTLRKGSTCPACAKAKLVPLIFGLPGMDLMAQEGRGEIVLGGCVSSEFPPELECLGCEARFKRNGELVVADER
jgi:hypothetical protein